MSDWIFYYLFMGLSINSVLACMTTQRGGELSSIGVLISVLIWPVTISAIIGGLMK